MELPRGTHPIMPALAGWRCSVHSDPGSSSEISLPPPGSEATPDFSNINFDRLWAGRQRVTEVEGGILARSLAVVRSGAGLEIGAGSGRLTPYALQWSRDIVALDATFSLLRGRNRPEGAHLPLVCGNVYHLPFRDGTFAAATLVRVFAFLTDPSAALREVHRVLRTNGILVLSFEPHPSVGSLIDDLKVAFSPTRTEPMRSRTFSRESIEPVRPSSYPAWSHTRAHVRSLVEAAGFSIEMDSPCGLEDLIALRRLRASLFLSLSRALSRMGGFPSRFIVLRKGTDPNRPHP